MLDFLNVASDFSRMDRAHQYFPLVESSASPLSFANNPGITNFLCLTFSPSDCSYRIRIEWLKLKDFPPIDW